MLYHMCTGIADQLAGGGSGEVDIIKVITDPFVDLIIQINSTVLEDWAADECDDCKLQKIYCPDLESDTRCDYLFNFFGKRLLFIKSQKKVTYTTCKIIYEVHTSNEYQTYIKYRLGRLGRRGHLSGCLSLPIVLGSHIDGQDPQFVIER